MRKVLKTGFLLGLGAAATSKEKVSHYVDDLVSKGKVKPDKADALYAQLLTKGTEKEEELSRRSKERIRMLLEDMHLVSRDEHAELLEKVDTLERRVLALEQELAAKEAPVDSNDHLS
ncbi:hypothetical protein FLK61_28595 [Paenalkalicoccus suaedae]|uniref:Polyhydroxyalkanoate synthesis regulator n=1 Tax=Paenalkalicoccus suaedae TaxID=2592382 RepID=A0A859FCP2_9BACI|nr:hypothetical protein [Paenalkalicoccus suaedae]QKS70700.1 hypothetical protein FLK61_28595 [Paenalkalicoccus suaedae]